MNGMAKGVALITGASRGIGRGIALELARRGYEIIGCATQADPAYEDKGLYEVRARVLELGRDLVPVTGDIGDRGQHARMVETAFSRFGRVDVLVNNAGVAPLERREILETTDESFDRVMGINLRGPFFFTQAVAQRMIVQEPDDTGRRGAIIFITSVSANTASVNRAEYCISKAGLSMAAQTYAVALAEHAVNVYELRPGIVETDMTAGVRAMYDQRIKDGLLLQPRWGRPEDVGKACAAIVQGDFDYATGAVIEIGGGFGVRRL